MNRRWSARGHGVLRGRAEIVEGCKNDTDILVVIESV